MIEVVDDGRGMDSDGATSAMTLGYQRDYKEGSLGHFGLGLKASFVPGVPHEAQLPTDERPPTVVVLQQRGHLPERDPASGSKRKGRLGSH